MAHFAEIDKDGTVIRVLVVSNDLEHRGHDFLANDLNLGGEWVQCSYNNRIRKQYPGVGYTYDRVSDVFVSPQPFPSWVLDANHNWVPPIAKPDGAGYFWDESVLAWV